VQRQVDGTLRLVPRLGVTLRLYGTGPVADLTAIDRAPQSGYQSEGIQAVAGYGYVFRVVKSDGVHFAAVRVAHAGPDLVIFDWSYQTAVGGADLSRSGSP
jgi:hypothetical protein